MMLDYGCGDGGFDEILPDRISRGSWMGLYGKKGDIGLDYNANKIANAKANIKNGSRFILCDGKHTHLLSNSVDSLHCYCTLHHMDDWRAGVKEIVRILKPGGEYYVVETVDNNPVYKLARHTVGKWRDDEITSFFTSYELLDLFREGTHIDSVKYYHRFLLSDFLYNFRREPQISLHANLWFDKLLQRIGLDQYLCVSTVIRGHKNEE
jgi:ubiquinone/menaquinone biosynthesis C-methylase UbiE